MKLILASQSPRRKQLLAEAGFTFDVLVPDEDAEDDRRQGELPKDYVCRLAFQKAQNVARRIETGIILGCDTVALCGGEVLEKPVDRRDARQMLQKLRGQEHVVLSGLCLLIKHAGREPETVIDSETTKLLMRNISDEQLEEYLDTGLWQGKAGAFGYQDGNDWITVLEGSEKNVVGLPAELLAGYLHTGAAACV